jgi:hypothetical protein
MAITPKLMKDTGNATRACLNVGGPIKIGGRMVNPFRRPEQGEPPAKPEDPASF